VLVAVIAGVFIGRPHPPLSYSSRFTETDVRQIRRAVTRTRWEMIRGLIGRRDLRHLYSHGLPVVLGRVKSIGARNDEAEVSEAFVVTSLLWFESGDCRYTFSRTASNNWDCSTLTVGSAR